MGTPLINGSPQGASYGKNHLHTFEGDCIYPDFANNPDLGRFKSNGYQDVWAMVLFYIQFLAAIIVGAINIKKGDFDSHNDSNGIVISNNRDTSYYGKIFGKACGAGFGIAVALTVLCLILIKQFPASFIWIANGFVLVVFAAYAGIGFYLGSTYLGVIGIVFFLLSALWLYSIRHRIPFSALLLESGAGAALRFHGTIFFAFFALVLAAVYFCFWSLMAIPTIAKIGDSDADASTVFGVCLVFLFMFYWTTQTIQGVVHCTAGGAVATWYFVGSADMPPNPAWSAFKRAMTTSFGSICFGAFVVAILKTLEAMARASYRQNRNSIGACIALCCIQCIERMMEYFNTYAFSFISIYGCSYIEAAKETWNMIINGSIWAGVINDILVDRVFFMCTVINAALCGVCCYFIVDKEWIAAVAGALVGIVVSAIIFHTVSSSVTTLLVCVADAPEVFTTKHPELSQKIVHAIRQLRKGCCDSSDDNRAAV